MFKHKYKKLYRYYKKLLKKSHDNNFYNLNNNLNYFTNYLRFMRDYYIVTLDANAQRTNEKLLSLCYAVREYELYASCIENYFTLENNMVIAKDTSIPYAEVQKKYQIEKQAHWNNLWETVKKYMESWFSIDENIF